MNSIHMVARGAVSRALLGVGLLAGCVALAGTAEAQVRCNPGDPDCTDTCGSGCGTGYRCTEGVATYYTPGNAWSIGAQKGDILFKKPNLSASSSCTYWTGATWLGTSSQASYCAGTSGCFWNNDTNSCKTIPDDDLVWLMLQDLGQVRVHTGLVVDADDVVHNTRNFDISSVEGVAYNRYGGGHLSPGDIFVDPYWLKHGTSADGVQVTDVSGWSGASDTTVFTTWNAGSASPPSYWGSSRAWTQAVVDYMRSHPQEYNIAAYTNLDTIPGAMCSGSVLRASRTEPYGFSEVTYSAAQRENMAYALYSDLTWYIANNVLPGVTGALTSTGYQAGGMGVARQIVNCFAFNQCGDSCPWTGTSTATWAANSSVTMSFQGLCPQDAYPYDFSSGWNVNQPADGHYINDACPNGVCNSVSPDDMVNQIDARATNYEPVERAANIEGGGYTSQVVFSCQSLCGDGVCASNENATSCPQDCAPRFNCGSCACGCNAAHTACLSAACTPGERGACAHQGLVCVCGGCQ